MIMWHFPEGRKIANNQIMYLISFVMHCVYEKGRQINYISHIKMSFIHWIEYFIYSVYTLYIFNLLA